jgi:hypothetical protein
MAVAVKQGTIVNEKKRRACDDFLRLFGGDSRLSFWTCCPMFSEVQIICFLIHVQNNLFAQALRYAQFFFACLDFERKSTFCKRLSNVHQPDPATEVVRLSAGLSSLTRRF